MNDDPNRLFKALAKLRGIRANVDEKRHETQEKYVHEYNTTVSEIAQVLQDNLETFLVPGNEIRPKVVGYGPTTGKRYSSDSWTETQLLLTKLDSLINYFEMLLGGEEPKRPAGFRPSEG